MFLGWFVFVKHGICLTKAYTSLSVIYALFVLSTSISHRPSTTATQKCTQHSFLMLKSRYILLLVVCHGDIYGKHCVKSHKVFLTKASVRYATFRSICCLDNFLRIDPGNMKQHFQIFLAEIQAWIHKLIDLGYEKGEGGGMGEREMQRPKRTS